MKRKIITFCTIITLIFSSLVFTDEKITEKLSDAELKRIIREIDDRQSNTGDYKATCYVKQSEKDKEDRIFKIEVYRRDADDKWMMIFLEPKEDFGKAYIREDKNLFMYYPNTGKWERRTERERIGGTNSRRSDFDDSNYEKDYDAEYLGEEKLGDYKCYKIRLEAKEEDEVAYPVVEILVDKEHLNVLKAQEFSLSGKLMRTSYNVDWKKVYSSSKKDSVWYPEKQLIYDELIEENVVKIKIIDVDLNSLPKNIFTKAWLEGKIGGAKE